MGFLFFGGDPRSSTASVQVALLGGGDFSLCLAPAKLGSHQSFHSNPLRRCREQPPASPSGWELSGLGAFTGCLAFLLRFHIFSSPPSPSPRTRLQLPRGSCHPPPPPTASFCPPKSSRGPCGASPRASGCRGRGHFPGTPLPRPWPEASVPSKALSPSSLARPIWIPAPGTGSAAGGVGVGCQGGDAPGGAAALASAG